MKKMYIPVFLLVILVFIISYYLYKGKIVIEDNKINDNDIYYCSDDTYTLNGNSCEKYESFDAYILGDITNDQVIDINDVNYLNDYINQKLKLNNFEFVAGDLNYDKQIDIEDINLIKDMINNNTSNIYVCPKEYTLEDSYCLKKVSIDAKQLSNKFDLNKDNIVDINDYIILDSYINNKSYLDEISFKLADFNKDGIVDKTDLKYLKKYTNKGERNYKNINYKQINLNELSFMYYESEVISDKIKYIQINLKFNVNNEYYKVYKYNNDLRKEESFCKKTNEFLNTYQIDIKSYNDYGIIRMYNDENCLDEIYSFKTKNYKID